MYDTNLLEDQPIAWTPTPEVIERSQLTRFMKQVGVSTWDELYQFSIRDVEKFTEEVLKFLDIKFDPPYEKLLDTSNGVEFPDWFSTQRRGDAEAETRPVESVSRSEPRAAATGLPAHAGLNITEMCLDRWQTDGMKDQPAVIFEGEAAIMDGVDTYWYNAWPQELTYGELAQQVNFFAAALRKNGFGRGDAIAIHLPMIPQTIISLLAIGRIGAIAVPVFSGYGVSAIEARLNAVNAKAILTSAGFPRRGKYFDSLPAALEAAEKSPSIEKVFISIRYGEPEKDYFDLGESDYFLELEDTIWSGEDLPENMGASEPTSAEDPLIILYTSGTTGKPKGIAHTHASFPIKAAQDMAFGTDVGKGTRICWYTDIGWMMGPWLIYGALINGATICIYDGAPDYPTPDRMWEFCAKHKVEVLGISPTLIRSLAAHEERSADTPVRMDAVPASTESETTERRGWYRHKLPHYDGRVTQFITFRLADSLPQAVLEKLRNQLEHDKVVDFSEEYRSRIDECLDAGAGECILRDPAVASLVEETILNEHGKSCDVKAWVVMPNHAHVLLRPYDGHDLAGIMKRIKGVSARKINQLLGRGGSVWQADYFDRYIRDSDDFLRKIKYIEENPVTAGLVKQARSWKFSSANQRSADTPVGMSAKHEQSSGGSIGQGSFAGGDADRSVRAPFERYDLSNLRMFASTGEPWNPAPWWWLFEKVGNSKLPIINYSGGTEISGGILMGNPLLPQKPCSFSASCPGMDVDILDENGEPVKAGEVGELVIKQPWIGMARGFWRERERYLETYWSRFKNIWVHGDWAMRDSDGHWFILGRSDDTLKVAGKRVGPAEVESILVSHPLVVEAAVIGVPDEQKGTAMVAFCVLRSADTPERSADTPVRMSAEHEQSAGGSTGQSSFAASGDADRSVRAPFESDLKTLVAKDMGKPLAPSKIHFVSTLPKTRNAKVMRRVIRSAYLGEDPGDLSALENPQAVEEIRHANK